MFDFDMNVEFLRMALWQIVIVAGPILGVALAIGLLIGIIQAATSINEMTLSFVPKLVLVLVTFGFAANFMLISLTDYFAFIFDQIKAFVLSVLILISKFKFICFNGLPSQFD